MNDSAKDAVYMLPCKPGSVYVNLGRECLNDCRFCVSRFGEFFGYDLSQSPPSSGDIEAGLQRIEEMSKKVGRKPKEVVICGVGEPFLHYDAIMQTCKTVRGYFGDETPIRADTAGLWWARNKRLDFLDYFDTLSVSLNAESGEKYNRICLPKIQNAYGILRDFLYTLSTEKSRRNKAGSHCPDIRLTVVDTSAGEFMPPRKPTDPGEDCPVPDMNGCKAIADELGFPLVVKELFRDSKEECWNTEGFEEKLLKGEYLEKCAACNHRHI